MKRTLGTLLLGSLLACGRAPIAAPASPAPESTPAAAKAEPVPSEPSTTWRLLAEVERRRAEVDDFERAILDAVGEADRANDRASRTAVTSKLDKLRADRVALEARLAGTESAARIATRVAQPVISKECQDNPLAKGCMDADELPIDEARRNVADEAYRLAAVVKELEAKVTELAPRIAEAGERVTRAQQEQDRLEALDRLRKLEEERKALEKRVGK